MHASPAIQKMLHRYFRIELRPVVWLPVPPVVTEAGAIACFALGAAYLAGDVHAVAGLIADVHAVIDPEEVVAIEAVHVILLRFVGEVEGGQVLCVQKSVAAAPVYVDGPHAI